MTSYCGLATSSGGMSAGTDRPAGASVEDESPKSDEPSDRAGSGGRVEAWPEFRATPGRGRELPGRCGGGVGGARLLEAVEEFVAGRLLRAPAAGGAVLEVDEQRLRGGVVQEAEAERLQRIEGRVGVDAGFHRRRLLGSIGPPPRRSLRKRGSTPDITRKSPISPTFPPPPPGVA